MKKKIGVEYPEFSSFIVSFLLYFSILFLLLFKISTREEEAPRYTDDKNAFMDVFVMDVDDSPVIRGEDLNKENNKETIKSDKKVEEEQIKTTTKQITPTTPPPQKQKEEVVEKKETTKDIKPDDVPDPDKKVKKEEQKKKVEKKVEKQKSLNDLFASATDNNKNLEENEKRENAIQSRRKSDKETLASNKKKSSSQKANEKGEASGKSMMTGIYNEFLGKIEKQLVTLWNTYTSLSGNDATIKITIDENGRLSEYRILELSYNDEFNQKVRDFENVLERTQFPKPPNGKPFTHKYKLQDLI